MDNTSYTLCPPTPESSDPETCERPILKSPDKRYADLATVKSLLNDSSSLDSGTDIRESPTRSHVSSTWTPAAGHAVANVSTPYSSTTAKKSSAPRPSSKGAFKPSGKPKYIVGPLTAKRKAGIVSDHEERRKQDSTSSQMESKVLDPDGWTKRQVIVKRKKHVDQVEEALKNYNSEPPPRKQGQCESCLEWCALFTPGQLKLCSRCTFWSHPYHLPVSLCIIDILEPEASSCFFCNQINAKVKPKSIEYDNKEDLSAMGDNKPSNAHEYVKEAPAGNYKQWKFFWNLKVEKHGQDVNIKLGDCVYIKHVKGGGRDLMRVQYLIKDSQKKPWFSGYHIVDTHHSTIIGLNSINQSIRDQFKNMVMTVGEGNGWAPVTSIIDVACCLYKKDYQSFQPKMFGKSKIFPIIYNYDWRPNLPKNMVEDRWTFISGVLDYPICKNPKFSSIKVKEIKVGGDGSGSVCSSMGSSSKPGPKCSKSKQGLKSSKAVVGPKSSKKYADSDNYEDSDSE